MTGTRDPLNAFLDVPQVPVPMRNQAFWLACSSA